MSERECVDEIIAEEQWDNSSTAWVEFTLIDTPTIRRVSPDLSSDYMIWKFFLFILLTNHKTLS